MCGIAGFWDAAHPEGGEAKFVLERMTSAIRSRGPDAQGAEYDRALGLGFGHRRLSILDRSECGAQPMRSVSGRWSCTYNGEIYNFEELRSELVGVEWRGHSDTEVALAAVEAWGVEGAVRRFNGMFALALFDHRERKLWLVRDRLGIKPLYVARAAGLLIFGSTVAALTSHPGFDARLDRSALASYLDLNYLPGDQTVYRSARALAPGRIVCFDAPDAPGDERAYWSSSEAAARGQGDLFRASPREAVDALEAKLKSAVARRLVADVPLGAFLSGGVDSSVVVALMSELMPRPPRTFSIGFQDAAYDESSHARAVAAHLGAEHTELILTEARALELASRVPALFDQPFADPSQIPTYLVSELARGHVTVALSGDGGDELFGGYNRHVWLPAIWSVLRRAPLGARRALGRALGRVPVHLTDRAVLAVLGGRGPRLPGAKLLKVARALESRTLAQAYRAVQARGGCGAALVRGGARIAAPPELALPDGPAALMLADMEGYMVGDILTKVDRCSMAVSLEARVPLLDHEVVEFAWRLPDDLKIRDGVSKWILREVLYRRVPRALIERPKMGFAVPIGAWMRGPLRDWVEALLDARRLEREGIFEVSEVRALWESWRDHGAGSAERVWGLASFQAWMEAAERPPVLR